MWRTDSKIWEKLTPKNKLFQKKLEDWLGNMGRTGSQK